MHPVAAMHSGAAAKQRLLRSVVDKINALSSTEHAEIYKLIKANTKDVHITHNSNGAFLNFSNLPDDVVLKVSEFTDFVYGNKMELDEYDRRINECKVKNDCKPLVRSKSCGGSSDPDDDLETEPSSALSSDPTSWQKIVTSSIKTDKDKQELARFVDAVTKAQQTNDARFAVAAAAGKTNAKNKFLVARKKYGKRYNRTTDADLPDHLTAE